MYPHVTQFEVLKQERERQFRLLAEREVALREPTQPRRARRRRAGARIVPA